MLRYQVKNAPCIVYIIYETLYNIKNRTAVAVFSYIVYNNETSEETTGNTGANVCGNGDLWRCARDMKYYVILPVTFHHRAPNAKNKRRMQEK